MLLIVRMTVSKLQAVPVALVPGLPQLPNASAHNVQTSSVVAVARRGFRRPIAREQSAP